MSSRQLIPDDLAGMAPGPGLASVLAGIDPARLCGFDAVEVLKAQYRQVNHERARLMAAMVEVGLCDIGPDDALPRRAAPDEFSPDEVRVALVLTRRAADTQFWAAYDLLTRLPAVHAAMAAGVCDEPRARILSEWTLELSEEQARVVCDLLLPRVGELTTGQLIEQIKRLAITVDPIGPGAATSKALAGRKVVGRRNPDGSANLSDVNLPVERVAAATARIDALAKATKHAGSSRPIDHLRAELFLGMTDGSYTALDDATIITLLLATPGDTDVPENTDDRPTPGDADADSCAADSGTGDGGAVDGSDDAADSGDAAADSGDAGSAAGRGCGGIELRVRVSTLLGRDRYPGEIAGWGPVHAELARDLAGWLTRGEWRFAITDPRGHLALAGLTRARPTGTPRGTGRSRDIVELQIPATLLSALARDSGGLGPWAAVIGDLARQHADHENATRTGADRFAGDTARRHPGAAQRRHLQIRDRRCIGPGCRAPARHNDQDHTHGGPTLPANLGGACRHDHRLKGEGGWLLAQPDPGNFRWTSRLGHTYHVQPEPIIEPLPDPIPRDRDPYSLITPDDHGWEHSRILDDPEPEPPPVPHDPNTDPPPF